MLLTVIPFSKLVLAILVKLVAPNKPEGNKWNYMMGMGMSMFMFTVSSVMRGVRSSNRKPPDPSKSQGNGSRGGQPEGTR